MSDINAIRRLVRGPRAIYASRWLTESGDQSARLLAAWNAVLSATGPVQFVVDPGTYALATPRRLLLLRDNVEIIMEGAIFTVADDVDTTGWDLTATDGAIYDNGIFYYSTPGVSNLKFYGGRFEIGAEELNPIQIGISSSHTTGTPTDGTIYIDGLQQIGGAGCVIASMEDVRIRNHELSFPSSGLFLSNSRGLRLLANTFDHIGVNVAEDAWINTAAIVGNNSRDVTISDNLIDTTGGTAIQIRSSNERVLRVQVSRNVVKKAGNGGIQVRTSNGTSMNLEDVQVANNIVKGWQCRPDSDVATGSGGPGSHNAIAVGAAFAGSVCRNLQIVSNQVDWIEDGATWNSTTKEVDDSTSPAKTAVGAADNPCDGIGIPGQATSYNENVTVALNSVFHTSNMAIQVLYALGGTVTGNTTVRCGYERTTGSPTASANSVYVDSSAFVKVNGNTFVDSNPGCDGTSARTIHVLFNMPLRCECYDNTAIGNDVTAFADAQNNRFCRMEGSGSAWAAISGVNTNTASLPSLTAGRNKVRSTRFSLITNDTGSSNYALTTGGILTVTEDDYVRITDGAATVGHGITKVRKDNSTASTVTLRAAAECVGTYVDVVNTAGTTNDITMAAATGTITATTLTPGQYARFFARGTNWERVI